MEVIVFSKSSGTGSALRLGPWATRGFFLCLVLGAVVLAFLGFRFGASSVGAALMQAAFGGWERELQQQRRSLTEARRDAENNLNALAQRMGEMQARIIRLDAMGSRLVEMAELDAEEFDFSNRRSAMGGPETMSSPPSHTVPDFLRNLDRVASRLEDREQKLRILEMLMMTRRLQDAVQPAGRPVAKGWISSYYGRRTDPISGKKAFHHGLDFAGKKGSDVITVAAGVVTYSGSRAGYGKIVEVTHGHGLVTRYAHNKENMVKVGEKVNKGQTVALMGTSGRTTGPHVHFEVLRNGKTINPIKIARTNVN